MSWRERPGERGYARTTASILWVAGIWFGYALIVIDRDGWGWRPIVGAAIAIAAYTWCLSRSERHDEASVRKGRALDREVDA